MQVTGGIPTDLTTNCGAWFLDNENTTVKVLGDLGIEVKL